MSIEQITIILFGGLLFLLALGLPVIFALGGLSVVLIFIFDGPDAVYTVATTTYQQITSPTLMTIPLFLIMGNFLVKSGISERMYNGLSYWLSGVRGGLAIVSIGVCVALAMCGGFGPGILTMGLVAVPAMLKHGYSKNIALGSVMDSCQQTLKITGMALWILIPATLFGVFYTTAGAQDMIMGFIQSLEVNRYLVLMCMQLVLLVFGMFMDDYAVVTICAPIMLPIARLLGFDPIWFSILFILNMQVAYLTPPFGWALIMMKGVAPAGVTTREIWRSVPPFVLIQVFVLILVMIFPQIAIWLPNTLM